MAYVKIFFIKHLKNALSYIDQERGPDSLVDAVGCTTEDPKLDFRLKAEMANNKGSVEGVHIIQSWNEQESSQHGAQFFQDIGKEMVSQYFKGHDFVIATHTETGKTHNHILVSPWHNDTQKKITNKKIHLYKLRELNDKLCLERGLSVINQKQRTKELYMPEKVRQMTRFNGRSWLLDLVQKIDFAKGLSTSREDLDSVLDVFGIKTRITDKHITYYYPGKDQGKRGNKLGKKYDLEGLEKTFESNRQRIQDHPELQTLLQSFHANPEGVASLISKANFPSEQLKQSLLAENKGKSASSLHPSEKALQNLIPADELRRAKHKSIVEYAKANKIAITQNENGTWTLPKRPFVEIQGDTWINKRNRTQGNLIDFVAAYKDTSFLQAVAEINQNPRLLKLEKHLEIPKRAYNSFIIPKDKQMTGKPAEARLQSLFSQKKVPYAHAEPWIHKSQIQVHENGSIFMFPQDSHESALVFERDNSGTWNKNKKGNTEQPFYSQIHPGRKVSVHTDPFGFTKRAWTIWTTETIRS